MRWLLFLILSVVIPAQAQRLHELCQAGEAAPVVSLLEKIPEALNEVDAQGRTGLHYACAGGHKRLSRVLLDRGAKPDVKDNTGETALVLAIRNKRIGVAQLLMQHGAFTKLTYGQDGRNLLHEAVLTKSRGVVSLALDAGISVTDSAGELGTPFHLAAELGDVKLMIIMQRAGGRWSSRGSRDEIPLHRAAAAGHFSLVKFMVREGSPHDLEDEDGKTPADWATSGGHQDLANYLRGYPQSDRRQ